MDQLYSKNRRPRTWGHVRSCGQVTFSKAIDSASCSEQQVLDGCFQLGGIVGPVAVDLQAVGADAAVVGGAPLV